jgi:U3 small nucleolar RNA-associated protein 25
LGVKITKAAVRPFVDFFGADIVFASPLGIVTAMNDDISAADFLSAIELVIVDRCDVVAMQNWEHLETVLEKCNQLPKDAKDVDVNRCHEFHLNGAAASARQTIFLSQFETAEINATFNGALCANVEGKFRLRATKEKGVLGLVASPDDPRNLRKNESATLPNLISRQEFELVRVSKKNIQDADDIRFRHFAKVVLPRIRENPDQGQLIFCATYFEFVRVRNLLVDREVSFAINSEYTDIAEAARARTLFADGRKRCLLLSERAYFYQRRNIRGVNSVFFYSLPENPQFYAEVCSFMKNPSPTRNHQSNTKNQFRGGGGGGRGAGVSGNKTAHALFTRLDALKIERVCGTKRGKKMIQETKEVDKKDNDMFVFC